MTLCWGGRQGDSTPPEEEWKSCVNGVETLEWYTVAFQPSEGSVRERLGFGLPWAWYAHPGISGQV